MDTLECMSTAMTYSTGFIFKFSIQVPFYIIYQRQRDIIITMYCLIVVVNRGIIILYDPTVQQFLLHKVLLHQRICITRG